MIELDDEAPPSRASIPPEAALPAHLVQPLEEGDWAFWKWIWLRGTGFPSDWVFRCAFPDCAAVAKQFLDAEEQWTAAQAALLGEIGAALDALPAGSEAGGERRKRLLNALRAVRKGKGLSGVREVVGDAGVDAIEAARLRREEARQTFAAAWEDAIRQQSRAIDGIARDERFREAVLWQNPSVFRTYLKTPEAASGPRNSERRRYEELVAAYLQRYAAKNDTIGFFGPVSWIRLCSEGEESCLRSGPELVAEGRAFLEAWCIVELAEALARDPGLLPWLMPCRVPFVRVDGTSLRIPGKAPIPLNPTQASVLQACDGTRTARELARAFLAETGSAEREQEIYSLLSHFRAQGLLSWGFLIPVSPFAGDVLRRQLEGIGDDELRSRALAAWEELERARAEVAAAAGYVDELDQALENLDKTFTRLTGSAPMREAGQTYRGRTLIYLDCARNLTASLGLDIQQRIARPLSLILQSARWFTCQMAQRMREAFRRIYLGIAQHQGSPVVDGIVFWAQVQPLILGEDRILGDQLLASLHDRWNRLFGIQPGVRRIDLRSEDLKEEVAQLFHAPEPGWQLAVWHTADLLIAAAGPEALRQGDYQLVLGQLHVGLNASNNWAALALHPQREDVFRGIDADLPDPRFVPLPPRSAPAATTRTHVAYYSPHSVPILSPDPGMIVPESQAVPISALVVTESEDGLVLRARDGRLSLEVVEGFGDILSGTMARRFQLLGSVRRTPRITIDDLVVWRETWLLSPEEIGFAGVPDEQERFLAARRWVQAEELPRFVFVKTPVEDKPFYVDLESPIYVDLLAKAVRRVSRSEGEDRSIRISEMLPQPDQAWLPDAQGRLYSSELRMLVVDRSRRAQRSA